MSKAKLISNSKVKKKSSLVGEDLGEEKIETIHITINH